MNEKINMDPEDKEEIAVEMNNNRCLEREQFELRIQKLCWEMVTGTVIGNYEAEYETEKEKKDKDHVKYPCIADMHYPKYYSPIVKYRFSDKEYICALSVLNVVPCNAGDKVVLYIDPQIPDSPVPFPNNIKINIPVIRERNVSDLFIKETS